MVECLQIFIYLFIFKVKQFLNQKRRQMVKGANAVTAVISEPSDVFHVSVWVWIFELNTVIIFFFFLLLCLLYTHKHYVVAMYIAEPQEQIVID